MTTPPSFPPPDVTPSGTDPETGERRSTPRVDDTTWETWWEVNRFEFLDPRFVEPEVTPRTDSRAWAAVDSLVVRAKVWPLLLELQRSPDVMVRTATMVTIGRVAAKAPDLAPQAREILLAAVSDRDRRVARAAIRGLVYVADGSTALPLHEAAASEVHPHDVRGFLTLTIPARGTNATDALLSSLWHGDEGGNVEIATLAALAHAQGGAGDALLERVAFDAEVRPELRATALTAIARRGGPDALALLVRALDERVVQVRRAAAMGIGVLDWRTPAEAEIEALRHEAASASAAPAVDFQARLRLLGSLVDPQRDAMEAPLLRTVKRLGRVADRDSDRFSRCMALISLGRIARQADAPLAVTLLERRLDRGRHAEREFALLGLALARAPSADRAATALLEKAGSAPTTRGAAAVALGLLGDAKADSVLLGTLESDPHPTIQGYAALALGMIGTEASAHVLHAFLERAKSPEAIGWGGLAVALMGRRQDTDLLVRRLEGGSNNVVGWNLVHALRMTSDRAAVDALRAIAANPSSQVQELGILALGYVVAREGHPRRIAMSRGYDYTLRHLTLDAYYFTL